MWNRDYDDHPSTGKGSERLSDRPDASWLESDKARISNSITKR